MRGWEYVATHLIAKEIWVGVMSKILQLSLINRLVIIASIHYYLLHSLT